MILTQNLSKEFGLTTGKLVTNVSDPEELNEELYVLSLRHINYGKAEEREEENVRQCNGLIFCNISLGPYSVFSDENVMNFEFSCHLV